MTNYLAVSLRQPRRYKFWLGRRAVDGSIALVAEFANEHELKNVVLKLNNEPIPELVMDPEQPHSINFRGGPVTADGHPVNMRPHPDSVRAHNQRWPSDQRNPENGAKVRAKGGADEHPAAAEQPGGATGAEPADGHADDRPDPAGR